jgi:hypothetical protein
LIISCVVIAILIVGILGIWFSSQAARFELDTKSVSYTYAADYYKKNHIVHLTAQTNTDETKATDPEEQDAKFDLEFDGKSYRDFPAPIPEWTINAVGQTEPFNDEQIKIKATQVPDTVDDHYQYSALLYTDSIPTATTYYLEIHVAIDNYADIHSIFVILDVNEG